MHYPFLRISPSAKAVDKKWLAINNKVIKVNIGEDE